MGFSLICDRNDGAVLDSVPDGGPEGWRYLVSERLAAEYPPGGLLTGFSPNFPELRKLYDFVDNILDIRVVSDRVRCIILELAPDDVEFLPLTLVDHQRDVASRDYFIMNVVADRDVIDLDRSKVRMSHILPEDIDRVWNLVLKDDIPPEGPRVFRPKHLRIYTMVTPTVQDALTRAGVTGVKFLPAHGWNGKFR
ncbi:hypothetical protein HPC49_20440 [Pyxidicoccus fallax]|uniref:Immunity MXAN-0049 protein domain-containing protein n=1 Tax=Pyxidicoccus fallax TaxID=394095 RepID=A0A848LGS8_9BACT|nr:DUF1629 domain-containing protein [Pyxidicoccus fallax]NMO15318.1 hypothetical protein [Pyxidicoccus fallax]NPC80582.1 hypothetical protein [Pyxidicoccus fallax]